MKELFESVVNRLAHADGVAWIDMDNGQLETVDYPLQLPCILIDFPETTYQQRSAGMQLEETTLQLRVAFNWYDSTWLNSPQTGVAMQRLSLLNTISGLLHGFAPAGYNKLQRTGMTMEPTPANADQAYPKIFRLVFVTQRAVTPAPSPYTVQHTGFSPEVITSPVFPVQTARGNFYFKGRQAFTPDFNPANYIKYKPQYENNETIAQILADNGFEVTLLPWNWKNQQGQCLKVPDFKINGITVYLRKQRLHMPFTSTPNFILSTCDVNLVRWCYHKIAHRSKLGLYLPHFFFVDINNGKAIHITPEDFLTNRVHGMLHSQGWLNGN